MQVLITFWKPVLEICILWFIIYNIMLFFEGTRAIQVVRGIIILIIAFFVFQKLGLSTLDWLLTKLFAISVLAILVIFQPEIRQGLARLGQRHLFSLVLREEELEKMLREVAEGVNSLSQHKTGTLIAIEREDKLKVYIDSGVFLDSKVSSELIQNIFTPNTLLHDGGVVIQQDRIVAAGCIFPLTEKQNLMRQLGMRHRAAIGLTEQTDAVVIVVSEETGNISLSVDGDLVQSLTKEDLFNRILSLLKKKEDNRND